MRAAIGANHMLKLMRIAVILGSTRSTRKSDKVGKWVMERAVEREDFEAELVDLAEQGLPIFDEPKPPGAGDYQHDHTKRWAALIDPSTATSSSPRSTTTASRAC